MTVASDHELDRAQWSALLSAHRPQLRAYLRKRTRSAAEADEVLAAAESRAWEKSASLRDRTRVRPWLYAVARTALFLHRRSERRMRAAIELDERIDERSAEPSDEAPSCQCAIAQIRALPSGYREVIERVELGGESLSELARALSITVNNATVRLSRARAALRERMVSHCGTSSLAQCQSCGCDERGCCASHGVRALR